MTKWTGRLILATVAMYALSYVFPPLWGKMVLVPVFIFIRPWTVVTYMFLHAGFMHILFNMIALYFFGPRVEQRLGGRHFLRLYFASGIAGALLSLVFTPQARIVGASGAIFGVMLAFAIYWPRVRIYIWGVLPIEARWLVGIMTAFALYGGFSGQVSGVANFAHLGGFLGGYLYLKWMVWRSPARQFKRQVEGTRSSDKELMEKWRAIRAEALHEANRSAYDEIARKVEGPGMAALTDRERAFINRFSPM